MSVFPEGRLKSEALRRMGLSSMQVARISSWRLAGLRVRKSSGPACVIRVLACSLLLVNAQVDCGSLN